MSKDILKKIIDTRIKRIEYMKMTRPIEDLYQALENYEHMYNLKFYDTCTNLVMLAN